MNRYARENSVRGKPVIMVSLSRMVLDHRTGQVHVPHEAVAVLGVMQNLGRTLIKIKWPAGGESVLLPEDIEACPCNDRPWMLGKPPCVSYACVSRST